MFARILVPLDGSAMAEGAVKGACALIDRVGGEVVLCQNWKRCRYELR